MYTPSSATATLPPNTHYGYSHHQNYQSSQGLHRSGNSLNSASRPTNTFALPKPSSINPPGTGTATQPQAPSQYHSSLQYPHTASDAARSMAYSQSAAASHSKKRARSRDVDWGKFYAKGLPQEIIVIEDTPPPNAQDQLHDAAANHNGSRSAVDGAVKHAAKKRKRDDAPPYDPVYHLQQTPSNTTTPYKNSNSNTGSTPSTGRTTSALHTTAATSLGSQYSHNGNGIAQHEDDVQHGQKRKRVTTRQQMANEAKRRDIEVNGDAFSNYKPPPRPPIKAADVVVKVMPDVSRFRQLVFVNTDICIRTRTPKIAKWMTTMDITL